MNYGLNNHGAYIRRAVVHDCEPIATLTAKCEGAARWHASSVVEALKVGALGWIAEDRDQIVGMILVRVAADEMEVLNLAVAPQHRRRGIATRLLLHSIRHAVKLRVRKVYLEVRFGNDAAREFYAAHNFRICGTRERYYTAPVEDALILSREVAINQVQASVPA